MAWILGKLQKASADANRTGPYELGDFTASKRVIFISIVATFIGILGAFVALAFERPTEFIGKQLEIAGSQLTNLEAAKVFSRVMGRPVKFSKLPMPIVRLFMSQEVYKMFTWFNEAGFQADIAGLRRCYPEVHLHTLEEWLREEGWHKRGLRMQAPKA